MVEMSRQDKSRALEEVLEQAAESIGDVTRPVLELLYQRMPKARQAFAQHGGRKLGELEASMVEQVLYCLMTWYERPVEVEIILRETVPHHIETLDIPQEVFDGLLCATLDLLESSVIEPNAMQCSSLEELRRELSTIIGGASSYS